MQHQPFASYNTRVVPFYRKKRTIAALLTSVLVLFYLFHSSSPRLSSHVIVDELNGLLYMVSHTEHILPHDLDTSAPIAHSVWTPKEKSNSKLWEERMATLSETPIIVFSKTYCAYSRAAKELLDRYDLKPAPKIVEVDLRSDGGVVKQLLIRLTDRGTFPNIILHGKSLGGYDDLQQLHESGALEKEFLKAGIQVTGEDIRHSPS
ncbi:thioredoxin-like protein [Hysterangium stoloniferum]|nr:thioredoxin-like protein [Hysterangium stoloniferum]